MRGTERYHVTAGRLLCDTRGAQIVEYIITLGMISLLAVAGFRRFGAATSDKAEAHGQHVLRLEGAEVAAGNYQLADEPSGNADPGPSFGDDPDLISGRGKCFAAGTPVMTERGLLAIEDIAPGLRVLARSEVSGEVDYRPVVRTFMTLDQPVVDVTISSRGAEETIRSTPAHPFFVPGRGWTPLERLEVGATFAAATGEPSAVTGLMQAGETATVYNIEVDEFHSYFVGRAGVLVHNQSLMTLPKNTAGGQFSSQGGGAGILMQWNDYQNNWKGLPMMHGTHFDRMATTAWGWPQGPSGPKVQFSRTEYGHWYQSGGPTNWSGAGDYRYEKVLANGKAAADAAKKAKAAADDAWHKKTHAGYFPPPKAPPKHLPLPPPPGPVIKAR